MTRPPNHPQRPSQGSGGGMTLRAVSTFLKGALSSHRLSNWFSRHVVWGNLVLLLFAGYGGFSLFHLFTSAAEKDVAAIRLETCASQREARGKDVSVSQGVAGASFICVYEDIEGNKEKLFMRLQPISMAFVDEREEDVDLASTWAAETEQCDRLLGTDSPQTQIIPASEADIDSQDYVSSESIDSEDILFGCRIFDEEGRQPEGSEDVFVTLRPIPQSSLSTRAYTERKITREHFNEVCNNKDAYLPTLKNNEGVTDESHRIDPQGAVYRVDALENSSVYPVFRWNCAYTVRSLNRSESARFGGRSAVVIYTGIDLDRHHCQRLYMAENLTKATYHDYNDPNSWYCTNPDPSG